MALGELYYQAIGKDAEAQLHLRPQLYWIWKYLNQLGKKISKVELEKALEESGVYSGKDIGGFVNYVTCVLLRDKWIVKKRKVNIQEKENHGSKS